MKLPTLDQVRDDLFARALAAHDGRVRPASKAIGVSNMMLYRWLEKKGLHDAAYRGK